MRKNKDINGCTIEVGENTPINIALKKFKQKVDDAGILETFKSKMFYEKPTTTRKRKKSAAKARWAKKLREQELPKKLY